MTCEKPEMRGAVKLASIDATMRRLALLIAALAACSEDDLGAVPPTGAADDRIAPGAVAGRICATESGVGSGTGYWLAGALVQIGDSDTTSDSEGRFRLDGIPAGPHTL